MSVKSLKFVGEPQSDAWLGSCDSPVYALLGRCDSLVYASLGVLYFDTQLPGVCIAEKSQESPEYVY